MQVPVTADVVNSDGYGRFTVNDALELSHDICLYLNA
jgi:hypothetical protein